ncbi:hypothetical protein ACS0TY_015139 [Phlomoides rotata]
MLDAPEDDMGFETESDGVPSYLQLDKESDYESELNLPPAPSGHAPIPVGRQVGGRRRWHVQLYMLMCIWAVAENSSKFGGCQSLGGRQSWKMELELELGGI